MDQFVHMVIDGIEADVSHPTAEELISGNPEFTCWEVNTADGGVSAGRWQATPGKWHFQNDYWEFVRIISGVSIITPEGGAPQTVRAGDSFVMRDGFKGTWECVETTLKDYVVRE